MATFSIKRVIGVIASTVNRCTTAAEVYSAEIHKDALLYAERAQRRRDKEEAELHKDIGDKARIARRIGLDKQLAELEAMLIAGGDATPEEFAAERSERDRRIARAKFLAIGEDD